MKSSLEEMKGESRDRVRTGGDRGRERAREIHSGVSTASVNKELPNKQQQKRELKKNVDEKKKQKPTG